jgi:hypothetical protein
MEYVLQDIVEDDHVKEMTDADQLLQVLKYVSLREERQAFRIHPAASIHAEVQSPHVPSLIEEVFKRMPFATPNVQQP